MPRIKNYIRLHPINTFNAVKALKLECKYQKYLHYLSNKKFSLDS